jgi:hypothetical protein
VAGRTVSDRRARRAGGWRPGAVARTCLTAAVLAWLGTNASAECTAAKDVRIFLSCTAELVGGGAAALSLTERGEEGTLGLAGGRKQVMIRMGDYVVSGDLLCQGSDGGGSAMEWVFVVELDQAKVPAPIGYARVGGLELATRRGQAPLTVGGYHFFTPAFAHPARPGAKLTRIDYACALHRR